MLANREVIISAGVYGSPAILMRSGVGNCSELSNHNISCREDNVFVGANLQDHMSAKIMFSIPNSTVSALTSWLNLRNSIGQLLNARFISNSAGAFTDPEVSSTVQPDTKIALDIARRPFNEIGNLYDLNWDRALLEMTAVQLRTKCKGKVSLASANPTAYPVIKSNYLCHEDDVTWAREMFRSLIKIVDLMSENDTNYQVVFPPKSMVSNDAELQRVVRTLSQSYLHPAGTCRMAPRDNINQGVLNGDLQVHGLKNVRVCDASVFATVPSSNLQAAIYALAGRAVEIIKLG